MDQSNHRLPCSAWDWNEQFFLILIGLTDSAVYPMLESLFENLQNGNVNTAKLKKFGLALGLSRANIDSILIRNKGEYEAVIALAIFTAWKSNIPPNEDNEALRTLDEAYKAVMQGAVLFLRIKIN